MGGFTGGASCRRRLGSQGRPTVQKDRVTAYTVVAYIVMAFIVMAFIVMVHIVMAGSRDQHVAQTRHGDCVKDERVHICVDTCIHMCMGTCV